MPNVFSLFFRDGLSRLHKYATNLSEIKKNDGKLINFSRKVLLFAEKVVFLQTE